MKYKQVLQILEHIILISVLSGLAGFYLGNRYGASHSLPQAVKQAVEPAQSK